MPLLVHAVGDADAVELVEEAELVDSTLDVDVPEVEEIEEVDEMEEVEDTEEVIEAEEEVPVEVTVEEAEDDTDSTARRQRATAVTLVGVLGAKVGVPKSAAHPRLVHPVGAGSEEAVEEAEVDEVVVDAELEVDEADDVDEDEDVDEDDEVEEVEEVVEVEDEEDEDELEDAEVAPFLRYTVNLQLPPQISAGDPAQLEVQSDAGFCCAVNDVPQ
ncbi:hypothetical protein FRC05_005011 [Tulasnella sp. 425]|nr:hypothetical protein FRC05_005011 [Tulasnella sp. 425]